MQYMTPEELNRVKARMSSKKANGNIPKKKKRVQIMYPGCADADEMSASDLKELTYKDFPVGTRVWLDGKLVIGIPEEENAHNN
jgi:hypothetical protein